MARPEKKGLAYFPFDVDFFEDRKIKLLRAEAGSDGVVAYIKLLCQIYRENGYYIGWSEEDVLLFAEEMHCAPEKIRLYASTFVKWSLFDRTLLDAGNVLTSAGIQRRYLAANKERIRKAVAEGKHKPLFKEALCLLDSSDFEKLGIQGLDKCALFEDSPRKNGRYSWKNEGYSRIYPQIKEKENKRKVEVAAATGKPFYFYQKCQKILGGTIEGIHHLLDPYLEEMEEALIFKAVEKAAKSQAQNWNYACKVLQNWQEKGIYTMKAQNEEEKQFLGKSSKKTAYQDFYVPKDEIERLKRQNHPKKESDIYVPKDVLEELRRREEEHGREAAAHEDTAF